LITIGIDPHKDTHTAAAVEDATGQLLGELTVPGTEKGHERLREWAHGLAPAEVKPRFALEDCRHVNGRLERSLLAGGETVLRVGTRMTARARGNARTVGKSDAIDALAVARAALREPGLPQATYDPKLRELKLLVDHREDLVAERTAHSMRLRWHLHDLDSGLEPFARTLNEEKVRRGLSQRLGRYGEGVQVRICRELLLRIGELTRVVNSLRKEIAAMVRPMAPGLLAISGVGGGRGAHPGRDRRAPALSLRRRPCPPRRLRADRGLLGAHSPPSPLAPGQPQAECHPPRRRLDPSPRSPSSPRLPGEEAGRREVQQGGVPMPQTTPGADGLQGSAGAAGCCCFSLFILRLRSQNTVDSQRCSLT
jgi:transposase